MSAMLAITRREFGAYFSTAHGYIIIALFLVCSGAFFVLWSLMPGAIASMRPVFGSGMVILLLVGPAVTMRMISEETRSGTIETLLSAPVAEFEIILGKFLAGLGFLLLMLAPSLIYVGVLELYGRPDYGEVLCGYLGMYLAGAAFMATGLFFSTLSSSQVVAFLVSFFFWLMLLLATGQLPQYVPSTWTQPITWLNPGPRLRDFSIGLIDSANVVYFAMFTIVFLLAAVKALGMRRQP